MKSSIIRLSLVIMLIVCMMNVAKSQCDSDMDNTDPSTGCDGNSYSESVSTPSDGQVSAESDEEFSAESDEELSAELDEELSAELSAESDEQLSAELDGELSAESDGELSAEIDSMDGAAKQGEEKIGADSFDTLPQNQETEEISAEMVGLVIGAGIIGLLLGGCIVGGIWYFQTKSKRDKRGYVPQIAMVEEVDNVIIDQDGGEDGEDDEEANMHQTR